MNTVKNEKEKSILNKLSSNIGNWSEAQKSYLFGYIEGVTTANKPKRKKNKSKQ